MKVKVAIIALVCISLIIIGLTVRQAWMNVSLMVGLLFVLQTPLAGAETAPTTGKGTRLRIGGCGGLYLLAEPGKLWVKIEKTDLHDGKRDTRLRAVLVGPDRLPLDENTIEGNGSVRLATKVEQKGVFVVNVTVSFDRYGEHVNWGFDTNCPHYLVETSRGHRDARHLEPIVLHNPNAEGNICFLPRSSPFQIEVSGLPAGSEPLKVYDEDGTLKATLPVNDDGLATADFDADDLRGNSPWRLHLPVWQATVHIDGVTRWERNDRFADFSLWSPRLESFFPFHEHRWMLTPYSRQFYAAPGESRNLKFRLHNNANCPDTLSFQVKPLSDENKWRVDMVKSVTLKPNASETISVHCEVPSTARLGQRYEAKIAVNSTLHPEMTTYSTITAHVGTAPYTQPLDLPIAYKPYQHENEQFGYEPDYPTDSQLYFDAHNCPYTWESGGELRTLKGSNWASINLSEATGSRAFRPIGTKVAFDCDNGVYALAAEGKNVALLCSSDRGENFSAYPIKGREGQSRAWDIEEFSGHNVPHGMPPFLRNTQTQGATPRHFWRRVNDLELFVPRDERSESAKRQFKDGDGIIIGNPVLVSDKAIGISSHSGIPSSIVSRDDRVHVIWGEATEPDEDVPGVPAYVRTYDRKKERFLGEPVFVGWGPPANDVHNTPSITIDSEGYLHTLTGTHGSPFAYARSLEPNTAHGGFTAPESVEAGLRSTYIGLVCGSDDALHLVFRVWTDDAIYHPSSYYANLGYKRKPKDGPWEEMRRLAVAPFSEYSIFYHRLTIDRKGRLFVSFDYWSTFWFYRIDRWGNRRKTIFSSDGGDTWKLLETKEL